MKNMRATIFYLSKRVIKYVESLGYKIEKYNKGVPPSFEIVDDGEKLNALLVDLKYRFKIGYYNGWTDYDKKI